MSKAVKRIAALFVVLALSALSEIAWSQGPDIVTEAAIVNARGITVHGHAEIKTAPDVAYVTFAVTTDSKTSTGAAHTNAERSQSLMDALKKQGIVGKDVQTIQYTLQAQYGTVNHKEVVTGYEAMNTIQATVHNLAKVGTVIDAGTQIAGTQVQDTSFDLSDRRHVEGEALVSAIAIAREKADLMAGAAGVSVGPLINLTENSGASPMPIYANRQMTFGAMATPSTPIAPQQIVVSGDVTAVYAIGPAR
jgi:uncharacterized protein YggE